MKYFGVVLYLALIKNSEVHKPSIRIHNNLHQSTLQKTTISHKNYN